MSKRYEVLSHLPPYGPMYIPISISGEPFYSEGHVVRFHLKDGSDWVANFELGWTELTFQHEFENGSILIVAQGNGYVMDSTVQKPLWTFGPDVREVIPYKNDQLILVNDLTVDLINHKGFVWESARISWDGIKDVNLVGDILTGCSLAPSFEEDKWVDFRINLETKEVEGGSFQESDFVKYKKPWWQFWK